MGCVQCKDKEAAKLTDDRETSLSHNSGYRYGSDPTPQHYPSFGVTTIPNYNNFHSAATQGVTVFGGVHTSSQSGTLRSRGGTGEAGETMSCKCLAFGFKGCVMMFFKDFFYILMEKPSGCSFRYTKHWRLFSPQTGKKANELPS